MPLPTSKSIWRGRTANPIQHMWAKPKLRKQLDEGHGHQPHLHEHWLEQFNDLIMVAFFSNLSHVLVNRERQSATFTIVLELFIIEMHVLHFPSYVLNIWGIKDMFTLFCCCMVSVGAVMMSCGVGTDAHMPCRGTWLASETKPKVFNRGLLVSLVAESTIHAQGFAFEKKARNHCGFQFIGTFLTMSCLLLSNSVMKYSMIATSLFVTYLVVLVDPDSQKFIDYSHVVHRLDTMVLVALGEWVIQIITSDHLKVDDVLSQTITVLAIALVCFGTRPPEFEVDLSTLKLKLFAAATWAAEYLVAYMIFFAALYTELMHGITARDLCGYEVDLHHVEHRRLGGGGGGGCHCEDKYLEWEIGHVRMFRAVALFLLKLLLLYIRTIRKLAVVAGDGVRLLGMLLGKKLLARAIFCFSHLAIPFIFKEKQLKDVNDTSTTHAHCFLLVVDLGLEVSIHKLRLDIHSQDVPANQSGSGIELHVMDTEAAEHHSEDRPVSRGVS